MSYEDFPGMPIEPQPGNPEKPDSDTNEKDKKSKKKSNIFESLPLVRDVLEEKEKQSEHLEKAVPSETELDVEDQRAVVEDVRQELYGDIDAEPDTVEEAIGEAYLVDVSERLDDGAVPLEEVFDESAHRVLAELDVALVSSEDELIVQDIPAVHAASLHHRVSPTVPPHVLAPSPEGIGPVSTGAEATTPDFLDMTRRDTPAATKPERRPDYDTTGADLLIGGVIGYIIGRRRGRIKTEEKFKPVREKLEKEVESLRQTVRNKEAQVRAQAEAKLEGATETQKRSVREQLHPRDVLVSPVRIEHSPIGEREVHPPRPVRLETIGKVATGHGIETAPRATTRVSDAEVLDIAAKVKVNGESVRHMYDVGRLDSIGLRRVVESYIRGDHFEQEFARRLKGKEMEFETAAERAWKQRDDAVLGSVQDDDEPTHKKQSHQDVSDQRARHGATGVIHKITSVLPASVQDAAYTHAMPLAVVTLIVLLALILLFVLFL